MEDSHCKTIKKEKNHEKNRTTFGTVGGLVTSSTMVPGRDEALGRHKSYKERMRYQRPIRGLFVIRTRYTAIQVNVNLVTT